MSDDAGQTGGGSARGTLAEQAAQRVGEQILEIFRHTTGAPSAPVAVPAEIGRLVQAFLRIDDPRIRAESVSLLEAVGGTSGR